LAYIIVSAGHMTNSRLRTIRALPLFVCAGAAVLLLATACITLGYRIALAGTAAGQPPRAASLFDPDRPEARALMDRVGTLSGRLTRVEAEAADLARRLGITKSAPAEAKPTTSAADPAPTGGPLVLVTDLAAPTAAVTPAQGDYGTGLARLESDMTHIEDALEQMTDVVAERDLTNMAYPSRLPLQGVVPRISSGFGVRHDPFTGRLARHMGLDIPAPLGTAVLASGGGRVVSAGFRGAYGNAVVIDHGDGMQTLYGHCSKLFVRAGDVVMPRQKIAAVGSTGRSTGPHLHFEVIRGGVPIEPGRFLAHVLARNTAS
jgi:murein DD-endopeptidase MepM/ murein hydrolase activator NlpD